MVDFLKGLSFLILPSGLGSKRMKFFENEIRKHSGELGIANWGRATRVIIDESVGEDREKCLMALKTNKIVINGDGGGDLRLVGTKWLSKCFAEKKLVDSREFEFGWMQEADGSPTKLDDGNKSNNNDENSQDLEEFSSPRKKAKHEIEESICSQSSVAKDRMSNQKKLIVEELQKLENAFTARKDTWRAHSYGKAVSAILRYDKDIETYQEARKIPGIGERMAAKIMEIAECGKLEKVGEILDEKTKILEIFCGVWGVGPSTAENWYRLGHRNLRDVSEKVKLTKQQKIGLKYREDFALRMNREEVERIGKLIAGEVHQLNSQCRTELVGSYRRGRKTCGDVDVMLVNSSAKLPLDILLQLTDRLRMKNYLTDDLVTLDEMASSDEGNHRKYMGVFKLPGESRFHRRIDIFVVPEEEYAAGLMHYTGSAMYNRQVRLFAARKGFTLNEHGLYAGVVRKGSDKLNSGELVPTSTEKDIFNRLGLEFKPPEERDH